MSESIFKIVSREEWDAAKSIGMFLGSPIDLQDGYVHFSTAEQCPDTAFKHFNGQQELVLVQVAAEQLGADLKWEQSRGGQLFPHLYSPLTLDAVERVVDLPLDSKGRHIFPPDFQ